MKRTTRVLTRGELIKVLRQEQPFLKSRFGVKKMAIFGSFAKDQATAKSDVDILVKFSRPVGWEFITLIDYLEKKLGRKADVLTPAGIKSIRVKKIAQDIRRSLINV